MKNIQYEKSSKLASIGTIGLLFMAGIFGFVLLVPLAAVHAASPTVNLSASSGVFGDSLTITGSGFKGGAAVGITTTVGTTTVAWLTAGSCSTTNGGTTGTDSLVLSSCLTTDALGAFETTASVPDMPAGAQTISVTDGTNTGTATFTMNPSINIYKHGTTTSYTSAYPEQTATDQAVDVMMHGFAASSTITITATSAFSSFPSGGSSNSLGALSLSSASYTVAETTGGSKSVSASDGTNTASTTFTINAWVSFYNSQAGATTFSFLGTTPTSVLIEGHGLPSGTIAANSITLGGVATTHASVKVAADGTIGMGSHLVVSPNGNVPFGQAAVVIGSNTFNFANGNINMKSTASAEPVLGGVLISSVVGGATSTAVAALDAATHGFGDSVSIWGYGFDSTASATATPTTTNLPGITFSATSGSHQTLAADSNGAIFEGSGATTFTDIAAGTYTVTTTDSVATQNVISPSYTVAQVLASSIEDSTINYLTTGATLTVHGFDFSSSSTTTVTATMAGTNLASSHSCTTSSTGTCTITFNVPDIAGGSQTITATDGTVSGTDSDGITVAPISNYVGSSTALTVTSGGSGTTTLLLTASTFGVHGLAASTAYNVVWNGIGGKTTVGSFTSTSTGGIPTPGVQLTIPADTVGVHIISIEVASSGADAFFGNVAANTAASVLSGTYSGQFGDLLFNEAVSLTVTPTVGNVGTTVTLAGSGLQPSTSYVVSVSQSSSVPGTGVPASIQTTYTSTSSGSVPAGTSFPIPTIPTYGSTSGTYPEQGSTYYVLSSTNSQFPTSSSGDATFILQSSDNLNMTSAPQGHAVVDTATGLIGSGVYNIVFNYQVNSAGTSYTGTTVGALAANSVGSASSTFTIPSSASPGTYTIQLVRVSGGPGSSALGVLSAPPSLTVTTKTTSGGLTTSTMTTSTPPSEQTVNGYKGVQVGYTNTASSSISMFAWVSITNSLGQTVGVFVGSATVQAGGSVTVFVPTLNLPPGSYTASVFATTSSGIAISTTSTTPFTV